MELIYIIKPGPGASHCHVMESDYATQVRRKTKNDKLNLKIRQIIVMEIQTHTHNSSCTSQEWAQWLEHHWWQFCSLSLIGVNVH